jgi:hypothetical protein
MSTIKNLFIIACERLRKGFRSGHQLFRVGVIPTGAALQAKGGISPSTKSERGRSLSRLKCAGFRDDAAMSDIQIHTDALLEVN